MEALKKISFYLLLALMLLPAIQYKFNIIQTKPLSGYFELSKPPEMKWFTWKGWMNESFQKNFSKAVEDNLGFRNLLIRINNQLNYTLFKYTGNKKVVIGKHDCLFEEGYITEYLGRDFIGQDSLERKLKTLKIVQEYLKKEKNIDLILVFEPGKASYHSEFIPARYHPEIKTISNYDYLLKRSKQLHIKHIDLNSWFLSMKRTTPYPLFPEYGVHWSTYGMCISMDSIVRYIEKARNIQMPRMDYSKVEYTDQWTDADFDIESTLNLLFRLKHRTMAYPEIKFIDVANSVKPDVLVIADSYCWSVYDHKIPQNLFSSYDFWYYNQTVYPDIWTSNHPVSKLNFKEEIQKKQVILLMITEMNLKYAFWEFPEQVGNAFGID